MILRTPNRLPRLAAKARSRHVPPQVRGTALVQAGVGAYPNPRRAVRRGPGKHWFSKPAVVMRGEREICNPATVEGCAEYKYRILLLWLRQEGWCCFHEYVWCPGRLKLSEATFEHENKRGGGKHDSRIWDEEKRLPMNGAAHFDCNRRAASVRLPIWYGNNMHYEKESA